MRALFLLVPVLFLLVGCYNKPVRHLASDAALIQPGVSTKKDVLLYLGEPNGRRTVSPGVEEYVYYEEQKVDPFGNIPVVGSWIGDKGYEMIIVTLKDDLVTDCQFRTFHKNDRDWMDDFEWQEVE